MEMPEMMAAWFAETERIHDKKEPLRFVEEFFLSLTLEFDWARNDQPHNRRYLGFLLQTVVMYLSGRPDEAHSKLPFVWGKRSAGMNGASSHRWLRFPTDLRADIIPCPLLPYPCDASKSRVHFPYSAFAHLKV